MHVLMGQDPNAPTQPNIEQQQHKPGTQSTISISCKKSFTPSQSFLYDPDCISLREKLLNDNDPSCITSDNDDGQVSIDLLRRLVIHLQEYEERCAASANYQDAKKIHSIQLTVKNEIKNRSMNNLNNNYNNNPKNVTDNDFIAAIKKKHESELSKFDNETTIKIDNYEKLHKQVIERFEKSWTEKPSKYRKPSQRLIELKKTEQSLAMTGQYDQAMRINSECAILAREEANEKQQKILIDYKNARKKLLEKQNRELQLTVSNRAEQRLILQSKQQREIEAALNRSNVNHQTSCALSKSRPFVQSRNFGRSTSNVSVEPPTSSTTKMPFVNSRGSTSSLKYRIYALPQSTKASIWAKNPPNASSEKENDKLNDQQPQLLPPLLPPTDPSLIETEQREKREKARQFQLAVQRREMEKKKRMEIAKMDFEREQKMIQQQQKQKRAIFWAPLNSYNNKNKEEINNANMTANHENESEKVEEIKENENENVSENEKEIENENENVIEIEIGKEKENVIEIGKEKENIKESENANESKNVLDEANNRHVDDDDSEYYYYEEEEEIIEEGSPDEQSEEEQFIPIHSCGSSSFHKLPTESATDPFSESGGKLLSGNNISQDSSFLADNASKSKSVESSFSSSLGVIIDKIKISKSQNSSDINSVDENIPINEMTANSLDKIIYMFSHTNKEAIKENRMYDPSDPLFHSTPNLKKQVENSRSIEILKEKILNAKRVSSNSSKNGRNSSSVTSTSMSDFEMDSIPLDVTNYLNGSLRNSSDFILDLPFNEEFLGTLEQRPTVLSQAPSAIDIKELTNHVSS